MLSFFVFIKTKWSFTTAFNNFFSFNLNNTGGFNRIIKLNIYQAKKRRWRENVGVKKLVNNSQKIKNRINF